MNNPHTYAAILSAHEKALLAKPGPSRGYVPLGEDVEPEDPPAGPASVSLSSSEDNQRVDTGAEFYGR